MLALSSSGKGREANSSFFCYRERAGPKAWAGDDDCNHRVEEGAAALSESNAVTNRTAEIVRKTRETDIRLTLDLDGTGRAEVATGVGFLDHMLELYARHGLMDLTVTCKGDLHVDDHH